VLADLARRFVMTAKGETATGATPK
jgi:hypothetical protein